ncbi:L,D-transpeptidase [Streptomyces sp. NPDC006458]|uniref:L,D-transpeptidase n=1 Tax=Streptomyces sp. NPDC006458 TaxID=3154302 RepID=UPI0033B8760C
MSARLPSWAWVTGLTAGGVAAVAVLAVQADKGPHPEPTAARPSVSAPASPKPKPSEAVPPAAPAESGTGRRVVYSLGERRVWLVDASDAVRRTFPVWPGTVAPDPGSYTVGERAEDPTTGSDGVEIEHIVYFALQSGVNIAFSNALDGSSPPPAQGRQTGGIRMTKDAGAALWAFATAGTPVRVVG